MPCIIYTHIPKCAGTSIRAQIIGSKSKIYIDSEYPPSRIKFFSDACERRNIESSFLDYNVFDFVIGHFPARRYRREGYRHVTLLRDPLDRAISHFSYWKNVLPASNLIAQYRAPIIKEIKSGSVSFLDFVRTISIYELFLGEMHPEDFVLVGFMDAYPGYLARLQELSGVPFHNSIRKRSGVREDISKKEEAVARHILRREYMIYDIFRNYWV